jgi:Protein of unknown function (DUF3800)
MLHAFIDESGDDGFAPQSSRWLVLGAYVIRESDMNPIKTKIGEGVKQIWQTSPPSHVHFVNCIHTKRKALLHLVHGMDLTCMFVAAHKASLKPDEVKRLKCPSLYCYIAKHLVERITWYARDRNDPVRITFAQRSQIAFTDLKSYFYDVLIHRAYPVHGIAFNFINSMGSIPANVNSLLQASDWITSGIAAGLNPDGYGHVELSYAEILWGKFWRRQGKFWSYGLKIIPTTVDHKNEQLFRRINTWLEDPTTLT